MHVTARGVKARNLENAIRLRDQRQRRALAHLKIALAHRDAAEDACVSSRRELTARQSLRRTGEIQAYGGLAQARPMSPAALSRHLAAIESLTDDVQRASKHLEQAQLKKVSADQSASKARGIHAMHAHQKRKWVRLAAMIATSRRARGEFLAEIDVEEEGSLGWRRCHLLRGKVR